MNEIIQAITHLLTGKYDEIVIGVVGSAAWATIVFGGKAARQISLYLNRNFIQYIRNLQRKRAFTAMWRCWKSEDWTEYYSNLEKYHFRRMFYWLFIYTWLRYVLSGRDIMAADTNIWTIPAAILALFCAQKAGTHVGKYWRWSSVNRSFSTLVLKHKLKKNSTQEI